MTGFPQVPVFNSNFKIPVKSQPPPPGTDAEQESLATSMATTALPPLPPLPPPPPTTTPTDLVFQSPMFYDPTYWAQTGVNYQHPQYGMQAQSRTVSNVAAAADAAISRKRKPDIDYMGKDDPNLPDDLKKMFNALHCVLCDVKVNSPISAKMHYSSKVS